MKTSTAKAKGRQTENALVAYLRARWGLPVERRRLMGSADQGDLSGWARVCVEVKSGAALAIPDWLRQTEVERVNAGAEVGVLVIRPKGVTDPAQWWAVQPVEDWVRLAHTAGYTKGEPCS